MKLSIIVPVYNVEKYIIKCITSLLDQNFDDYEVIVVNDGTEDNSIELIESNFKDDRLSIINQQNSGLSCARNLGLKVSKGEYVWFVDSDDWIAAQSLSKIAAKLCDCDILFFSRICSVYEESLFTVVNSYDRTALKIFRGSSVPFCVPYYIFRKGFLKHNNLSFEPKIFHEDNLFTPRSLYLAKKISICDRIIYYRLLRKGSTTHTPNPKRCSDLCIVISKLIDFADKEVKNEDRYLWGNCIADTVNGLLYLSKLIDDDAIKEKVTSFLQEHDKIIDFLIHSRKFGTRLLGFTTLMLKGELYKIYNFLFYIRYFPKSLSFKKNR